MLSRKETVQDEQVQEIYPIEMYQGLRRKIRELRINQSPRGIILSFPSGRVVYNESVDDADSVKGTQPQYKRSCEMPKPVRPMSVEEIGEFCAKLPRGVGEEEYLRRIDELGDAI